MTSQNINIIFKRKQSVGNNGVGSIGGASAMSYSPSSHTMPTLFQHRDSFVHQRELESAFCSDLVCCGTPVRDLHELLHHYEEHHHAPIEEEPEPKEENENNPTTEDDIVMDDLDSPFPLPTQPHELAALTSSPLLRKNNLTTTVINPSTSPPTTTLDTATSLNLSPSTTTTTTATTPTPTTRTTLSPHQQHTEEILRQALPALANHPSVINGSSLQESLNYFKNEALYQTCDDGQDKPYKCPIKGCDKAYKNPNGLKYHQMHGHSEEDKLSEAERDAQKPYMCTIGYCNKRYKNLNGLKYHIEHSHIAKLKQYSSPIHNSVEHILFNTTASNNNEAWRPSSEQQPFQG
ncbi:uncharacterized protein BX663DRAFT_466697 [Cokeromyces recurvatus]|uniref:uncharacterized protein n=1 Tax=Cokeromyces recurvatus TaxID=90255 RepID=UPI0022208F19|nr:uncharacterized protein BX663DRAFT_466697 [Cokeromyces recurvatus]KAI7906629.1 hypothetical protein BX663DRAFT_466697 [Cokeromyces recurvatus]